MCLVDLSKIIYLRAAYKVRTLHTGPYRYAEELHYNFCNISALLFGFRLAASAGEQIRVCVLTEQAFCIGTLCSDESNEWEVMAYSLNADCVAVMPGLALEGKIFHLICMVVIPEESCVCGLSSSEVVIWYV